MLDITTRQENGARHVRPTAEALAALVAGVGTPGNAFLVLHRVPDRPHHFLQIWRDDEAEAYTVELRDGGPDRHFRSLLADPARVAQLLTAWARNADDADERWRAELSWEPLSFEAPAAVPPLVLDEESRRELEAHLRLLLVGGYVDREELAEAAEDYLVDGDTQPVSSAQARELADRLWAERLAEQAEWEGETDPERLSRAFEALDDAGITARENFTCCRNCGHSEIAAEGAPDRRGFVYFHSQGTDSVARGDGLRLLYGGFDGSAETTTAVGREVRSALEEVGLPVDWNGSPERTIIVTPLDWRRRLVG
ncbi:DUF6891 domain-containing protein [Streptacidiphilus melanogenes]|uniref:DUF6891 domain-containing protein n=1 Tax=Streptacidiphilus melanogenes TaxID=411235 RepID=UPI0005A64021|nr:hypothetical protein [Streptacidiphilus melanogenes]